MLDLFPSRDAGPFGRRLKRARGARIPVTVVTGFLGAGKTTLVRRFLATPEGAGTAVVINEFGSVGIDDALVRGSSDEVTLLGNGCLCCNTRSDLQIALRNLVAERAHGTVPQFKRILIETSGLADPGPILQTFATDRALGAEFHAEVVVTMVDAATETHLRCTFGDDAGADAADPAIRDIATDTAPLLVAVRERSRLAHANVSLDRVLEGVAALEQDRATTAVIAEVLTVTNAIAGPAALVRPADGAIVAGDLSPHYALALVRDTPPPALVRSQANVPTGAVVAAGPGLALVTIGTRRELVPEDLRALTFLGEIAAAA